MGRLFDNKKNKVPLHRWLGLRPVDFVRAAERRAAVLQRHHPLSAIRYPRSLP